MNSANPIQPFTTAIEALHHVLAKFDHRGVVIGGIAVGFLGKPRFTEDVDALLLLSTQALPELLAVAQAEDLHPRIPNAEAFARAHRVVLLRHTPTHINIDISLGLLPFETEVVERAMLRSMGAVSVRLPTPEDLIIMKAIAHRPKDMEDIRTIIDKNPNLDVARIEHWVKSFGEVLDAPQLWDDIAQLFQAPHS